MTSPTTLPEDWQPTPGDLAYAKSRGICEAQALEIGENIRAYYTQNAKGMKAKWKEWHGGGGVWGTWIRKESPWPAWRVEQNEPQKEWYERGETDQDSEQTKPRNIPKPRVKRIPGPARPLGATGRQAIIDKMMADEPPAPKVEVEPQYRPMPKAVLEKFYRDGLPKELKRSKVPDEEMER